MELASRGAALGGRVKTLYNWLLLFYCFLFISAHSIIGHLFNTAVERLEVVTGLFLLIFTIVNFLSMGKQEKVHSLKIRSVILVYLVFRAFSFWKGGFDYSTLRSIFFETVYLLGLSEALIDGQFVKDKVLPMTVIYNLILNILNGIMFIRLTGFEVSNKLMEAMYKYTFIKSEDYIPSSSMYINPNTIGVLTGLSVLIVLILRRETRKLSRPLLVLYLIFSGWSIYYSQCRSAYLGLALVAVLYLLRRVFKGINPVAVTKVIFICSIAFVIAVTGYMAAHEKTGLYYMTPQEKHINEVSSSRYFIWKSGWLSNKPNMIIGCGNLNKQIKERYYYVEPQYQTWLKYCKSMNYDTTGLEPTYSGGKLGPHNGYMSMIFCTGLIGFALFSIILFLMISRSKSLKLGNWYLIIVFFITLNLFESLLIMNKYYICLLALIMLNTDLNTGMRGKETS